MDINTALHAIESKDSSEVVRGQAVSGDVTTSAEELAALLRRVSEAPTREIEKLINQLQRLRTQLQNAGTRIQRDIAEYTELSQQTMQLTTIISDNGSIGMRQAHQVLRKSSGSFAIFATVRRASSFVSSLAAASPVGQSLAALLLTIG
jgi:hypothetical protein